MSDNHDQRHAARFPVCIPVVYWGDDFLGEGTAVDVAPHGVLLVGNYRAVKGTRLRLMLSLPDDQQPLYVTRAVVRWVRGIELGVQLLTLPEGDCARFDAFIADVILHSQAPAATEWPWEDDGYGPWQEKD